MQFSKFQNCSKLLILLFFVRSNHIDNNLETFTHFFFFTENWFNIKWNRDVYISTVKRFLWWFICVIKVLQKKNYGRLCIFSAILASFISHIIVINKWLTNKIDISKLRPVLTMGEVLTHSMQWCLKQIESGGRLEILEKQKIKRFFCYGYE